MPYLQVVVKTPDFSYDYIVRFINEKCFHLTKKIDLILKIGVKNLKVHHGLFFV